MLLLTTVGALDFWQLTGDPNGTVKAKRGSIGVVNVAGAVATWQNTDGNTAWLQIGSNASGQWVLPSGVNPALQFGTAGDPDMLGFDTSIATGPVVFIGASVGLKLNDNSPLRFGSDGADVVVTPDGTDAIVSGTGNLRYVNDFKVGWGTTASDRIFEAYNSAAGRLETTGTNVNAGGASPSTRGMAWATGNRVKTDNNAAIPASGGYAWSTGATDITFAGAATGPTSGGYAWNTGNASSTGAGATSGDTGGFAWTTGNSEDGTSGSFVLTTGTGPVARGILDLNLPTIDTQTQATDWRILNGNAAALRIGTAGVPGMMVFNTGAGTQTIQYGEGVLTNMPIAVSDTLDGAIQVGFWLSKTFPAGAGPTDVVLPARVGGWRVVDAYLNNTSGGAGGGTLQVQTVGGAPISDAMIPGVANGLTRAAAIQSANAAIPSGGTVRLAGGVATTAGTAYVRIEPL